MAHARFSRTVFTLLAVGMVGLASMAAAAGAASVGSRTTRHTLAAAWQAPLLREINAVRVSYGLAPLQASKRLDLAASRHSAVLARLGVLSHVSPDGSTFEQRMAAAGYGGQPVGEDLAFGPTPQVVVRLWLDSPRHREILLSTRSRTIGLGLAATGRRNVFVTADFGA